MREQPDWQRALSAQADILSQVTSPKGREMAEAWVALRERDYGLHAAEPAAYALAGCPGDLITAEPLFITEEMQDLVAEASATFDTSEPLHFDDLFIPHGFMLLEKQFTFPDVRNKLLGFRAISWRYDAELPVAWEQEQGESEVSMEPVLSIVIWSHIDDIDDYPEPPGWKERAKQQRMWWGITHATTLPLKLASDLTEVRGEGDPEAHWLRFFRVTQRLMAEKIVTKNKHRVARPRWREAKRKGLDIKDVVVVELRREQQPSEARGGEAHYSHRFVVGGHWRMQWYPLSQTHRQKYIGRYIKGPDDKPLILKKRVWTWDR